MPLICPRSDGHFCSCLLGVREGDGGVCICVCVFVGVVEPAFLNAQCHIYKPVFINTFA